MATTNVVNGETRNAMKKAPPPSASAYEAQIYQKGLSFERTRYTFDTTKWQEMAHERLSHEAWNYVHCSAGQRETDDKNREAFRRYSIVPRRLVDMHKRMPDLSVEVLGQKIPFPIALAPVGVQT